jgi:hypothetical protein
LDYTVLAEVCNDMRKFLAGLVAGFLLATAVSAYAASPISLVINGRTVPSDPAPQIIQDRVFVPVRFVSEALGLTVGWDASTRTVSVSKPSITDTTDIKISGVSTTATLAQSSYAGGKQTLKVAFDPDQSVLDKYAFEQATLDVKYPAGSTPAQQHFILDRLGGTSSLEFIFELPAGVTLGSAEVRVATYGGMNQVLFRQTLTFEVVARPH